MNSFYFRLTCLLAALLLAFSLFSQNGLPVHGPNGPELRLGDSTAVDQPKPKRVPQLKKKNVKRVKDSRPKGITTPVTPYPPHIRYSRYKFFDTFVE